MELYKYNNPCYLDHPEFFFYLAPGHWVRIVLFEWGNGLHPEISVAQTKYVPKRIKGFQKTTRRTFIKYVGMTPEKVKAKMLGKLEEDISLELRELTERERRIANLRRLQKVINKISKGESKC